MTDSWQKLLKKGPPYRQATQPLTCHRRDIPFGPHGRRLCRCGCGQEAVPPRRVFVNAEHELAFRLATRWQVIRRAVWYRDKSVCAHCGVNADSERKRWKQIKRESGWDPDVVTAKESYRIKDTWEAHHVIPRSKGGTNRLNNIITLCTECHKKAHGWNGNGNGKS